MGILWERIMNFVYYLEKGEILDDARSNKRSKKASFFKYIKSNPKWDFLERFKPRMEDFDSKFRTPEFHKNSTLRKEILEDQELDYKLLLKPVNNALNTFWVNTLEIVSGRDAYIFPGRHVPTSSDKGEVSPDE